MSEAPVVNGSRRRLLHNEQFTPFYGSVAFENAPNLHAGLCGAKSGRRGGSGLVVSQPPPLACVADNIFGETPVKQRLDETRLAMTI